jgi:hypothetical protein
LLEEDRVAALDWLTAMGTRRLDGHSATRRFSMLHVFRDLFGE